MKVSERGDRWEFPKSTDEVQHKNANMFKMKRENKEDQGQQRGPRGYNNDPGMAYNQMDKIKLAG